MADEMKSVTSSYHVRQVLWSTDFRRVTAYRVLFAIGLADCIQLIIHVVTSITVIFQFEIPPVIDKVLWSTDFRRVTAYRVLFAIGLADCIQLIIHVVTSITVIFQFEIPPVIDKVLMATTLLGFAVFLVLKCLPTINYLFNPVAIQWITPSQDHVISHILRAYSNWIIAVYVALSAIFYTAIFLHIKIARSNKTTRRER
ncbi:hypothetical protein OSTOST_02993, partial [Ostertagia ostertagi]